MEESTLDESSIIYSTPKKKSFLSRRNVRGQDTPSKLKPINLLFQQYARPMNVRTGGLLGVEKKYLDCARTLTPLLAPTDMSGIEIAPTSGSTGCLSAPATGDAFNNRDGQKIQAKSILVKGVILVAPQINQTAADTSPVVCVSLIQDTQTNGAVYNSEDVYSNFSNEAGQNCNALRNPSYVERFKVIKTLCFNLPQLPITYDGANIEQPGLTIPFTLSKKLNFTTRFLSGGNTADIANVIDNSLNIIAWVNNTSYAAQIGFNSRFRFIG